VTTVNLLAFARYVLGPVVLRRVLEDTGRCQAYVFASALVV
jgi:hypothetical protein